MNRVVFEAGTGQRVPVRIWARHVPPAALRQLVQVASQPWVTRHVASMADAHLAEGVAVGTVFATARTVVPAALGTDLGCGMSAVYCPYPASALGRRELEALLVDLGRAVPVGEASRRGRAGRLPDALPAVPLATGALEHVREKLGPQHLGTLGGGNHFLEIDRDAAGDLWVLVHSGSRGPGAAIGRHHQQAARASGPGSLPGLDVETPAGASCLADQGWAVAYACENRRRILAEALAVVHQHTGAAADPESALDTTHNFVAWEEHAGERLLVHRKGATPAAAGQRAIVPGSMGTATYLVEGLGHPDAFGSCSHGAGRVMSRREARERISIGAMEVAMRRVVFDRRRARALVEEAPSAYRDLREVLEDQDELVVPVLRLEPLVVLKG